MAPPTFKKPPIIREIEALRVKPDEVLVLRFSEAVSEQELELMHVAIQAGPLKDRVLMMRLADGEGEATIIEAKP